MLHDLYKNTKSVSESGYFNVQKKRKIVMSWIVIVYLYNNDVFL